ncbi:nitrile hydratase subunit beta [Rhizobium sp. Root1204]|uniref:nitrile hydratase subunit beta n=1 Tax=Rhizobium sp. Root1204 TaxID=1736428 RepID=UPI0007133AE3|nr:nitrile hydratase subunit beta [Rhizobium sp. Root1204]KQV41337.1 hypothetical protein ASC96_18780 [Rhizobium sp. Root1204]
MNSIHDLGGMHGMGPLPFEENEPKFHAEWERTVFGVNMLLLLSGAYTADEHRHSMEKIPALHWLESPYYLHWIDGFETILQDKGIVTAEEMDSGKSSMSGRAGPLANYIDPDAIRNIALHNHPVTGDIEKVPSFKEGDVVRAKNINPRTHTRLPRYTRGKKGIVVKHVGACLYADARAHGGSEQFQHTYSVRFEGKELWGPDAGPRDAVYIDLYDSYLEDA